MFNFLFYFLFMFIPLFFFFYLLMLLIGFGSSLVATLALGLVANANSLYLSTVFFPPLPLFNKVDPTEIKNFFCKWRPSQDRQRQMQSTVPNETFANLTQIKHNHNKYLKYIQSK